MSTSVAVILIILALVVGMPLGVAANAKITAMQAKEEERLRALFVKVRAMLPGIVEKETNAVAKGAAQELINLIDNELLAGETTLAAFKDHIVEKLDSLTATDRVYWSTFLDKIEQEELALRDKIKKLL